MDRLAAFLFLISFIALIYGVVWLIIQLTKKQISRVPAIVIILGIVLFAFSSWTLIGSDDYNSSSSSKASSNEVSGPMTKIGQYQKETDNTPKYELVAYKKINKKVNVSGIKYTFTDLKLIKAVAKTSEQKSSDENIFQKTLGNTYYTFQASYKIKNDTNGQISQNGNSVMDPRHNQLDAMSGSTDSLSGLQLEKDGKKSGYIQSIATKSDKNKLTDFKIVLGQTFDKDNLISNQQTIDLN